MAVNAVGLNLLLQASPQQVQDLLQGLQPGAVLRGRIVDLLPQGKAVIQLQGQNLLAQLPPPTQGQSFQKGDLLSLQVNQSPASTSNSENSGSTAAVSLRLVTNNSQGGNVIAAALASTHTPAQNLLPPLAIMEQALIAAKVSVSSATMAAAQILVAHGLPLDAQTLQSVVQIAESLLNVEQAPEQVTTKLSSAPLPMAARVQLQEAVPALRFAIQNTNNASPRLAYQQALTIVENSLQGLEPASAPRVPLTPLAETTAPSVTTANNVATPQEPIASTLVPLNVAIQTVLENPSTNNLAVLQNAIGAANVIPVAATVLQPMIQNPAVSKIATSTQFLGSTPPSALPARREATLLLIQSLPTASSQRPLTASLVAEAARNLILALNEPQSSSAQTLIRSVQSQFPEATSAGILNDAKKALNEVAQHFDNLSPTQNIGGPQTLRAELEAASLPVTQQNLSQIPRVLVYEAVAWLKTRGLPPQRPLVEAAAQILSRDQATLDLAQQTAHAADSLPEGLLASRPGLKLAFQNLSQAIQRSTLNLETRDLSAQLKQWPEVSGLNLEKTLFESLKLATQDSGNANSATAAILDQKNSTPTLREALAQVQHEIKQTLRDPAIGNSSAAQKLEQIATNANRALQNLNALPLQAQPTLTFHTVTLPLALPLQGPLHAGQLSVTWRKGQERELNDKDPVNVAVALHTESLGEVRVMLQVWKGAVSAIVKTEDKATADFLASGAAELKQGFSDRTPFNLQSLDFSAIPEGQALPDLFDASPVTQGAGINLSA